MDIAAIIGLIGGIGMIIGAMISGGGLAPFIDVPSILIVFGGTAFLVLYSTPMAIFLAHFGAMAKALAERCKMHAKRATQICIAPRLGCAFLRTGSFSSVYK